MTSVVTPPRCASSAERPVRFARPRCFRWPAGRTNDVCCHRRALAARSSSSAAAVFERGVPPHSHVSVPTSLGPPATTARRTLFFQILLLGDMTAPESLKSGASISSRFSSFPIYHSLSRLTAPSAAFLLQAAKGETRNCCCGGF
ncbi:hypothetical protein BRADI_3g32382v3 [Brachypodium distachyon]|uniref:Uncharacterized protein n=1 Tax=Brachypodium distachyon TaxID=15368 RepID=A0A2K2D0L9_BRADI|nr:hypothetical protein BRADI_3g32382v3 [Brachypodium distachyon]